MFALTYYLTTTKRGVCAPFAGQVRPARQSASTGMEYIVLRATKPEAVYKRLKLFMYGPAGVGKIEKAKNPRQTMARLLPYLNPFRAAMALVLAFRPRGLFVAAEARKI